MMRYGRFLAAKQVAMAMQALIRQRFPQDSIDFVGFYSGANKIPESMLPLAMPKPVTIYDYQVRLKVPIDQIERAPQHFTNLHMGLQLARRILRKRASENKQIFIVTDGQPTAHVEGDFVYLLYPPDQRSTVATLKEAVLAVREGCRISTLRADRGLLGDGLGGVRRSTDEADQGRGVLHQQRRAGIVHHGELFEREEEEGAFGLTWVRFAPARWVCQNGTWVRFARAVCGMVWGRFGVVWARRNEEGPRRRKERRGKSAEGWLGWDGLALGFVLQEWCVAWLGVLWRGLGRVGVWTGEERPREAQWRRGKSAKG